jgi:hypothetical protein
LTALHLFNSTETASSATSILISIINFYFLFLQFDFLEEIRIKEKIKEVQKYTHMKGSETERKKRSKREVSRLGEKCVILSQYVISDPHSLLRPDNTTAGASSIVVVILVM